MGTIRVEDIEKLSGKSKPLRDTITLILVTRSTSPYLYLNEHKLKSWILELFSNVITTSTLLHECNRIMKNTNQYFYDLMPSKQNEIDLEPRHLMFLYGWLLMERSIIVLAKDTCHIHSSMRFMRNLIFPFRWVYRTIVSTRKSSKWIALGVGIVMLGTFVTYPFQLQHLKTMTNIQERHHPHT